MNEPILSCRNLVRYLGRDETRHRVLDGVAFEAFPKQAYSIVGPSGCGKSTLLYLLGLLDRPDEGEIRIAGTDVAGLGDREGTRFRNAKLGFVFQFHFLIKEFTAAENIMLPMRRRGGWSEDEMRQRARELLGSVGLESKVDRRANHLSGGEQQRVAIARSLANRPPILLADEPTGNLDSQNSDRAFDLLRDLVEKENLCLVVVTHNPDIAALCDHTMEMQDGRIVRVVSR